MATKSLMTSLILGEKVLHSQLKKKKTAILCKAQVPVDQVPFLERAFT
jgi:hypothetical protein